MNPIQSRHITQKPSVNQLVNALKKENVEFGRLMGWLRSKEEASAEMGYSLKDVENFFGTNHQLLPSHIKLLH